MVNSFFVVVFCSGRMHVEADHTNVIHLCVCFFGISTVQITALLFHSAAGSCQPEIIACSDDKLASKRHDSPGMSFYYLRFLLFTHGSKQYSA